MRRQINSGREREHQKNDKQWRITSQESRKPCKAWNRKQGRVVISTNAMRRPRGDDHNDFGTQNAPRFALGAKC